MKQTILIFCASLALVAATSCNNAKSDAVKQADAIQQAVKENSPGAIPTSENGYYMTAKIDGKEWSASHMIPDVNETSSYLSVAGENDGDNINFQLWKRGVEVGKKFPFSENHAVNLSLKDVPAFFGGYSGYAEVTKVDDQWMEGTFQFDGTSSGSDKKIAVTDGRFRVALVPGIR